MNNYEIAHQQVLRYMQSIGIEHPEYLDEYASTFGEIGIMDMAGFLAYAATRNVSSVQVIHAITHDLMGRNDPVMLPRTHNYFIYFDINYHPFIKAEP